MTGIGSYAATLGIAHAEAGTLAMPFSAAVEGRPGFLHGGAIAGLLEAAGLAAAKETIDGQALALVTITVDFLRAGLPVDTFANAGVARAGRRIVHVEARAWQDDPARPIGVARMSLVVGGSGG